MAAPAPTVEVVALDDHVAEIDADAPFDAAVCAGEPRDDCRAPPHPTTGATHLRFVRPVTGEALAPSGPPRACRLAPNKSKETKSLPKMGEARDTYLLNDYNSIFSEILSAALSSVSR